MHTSTVTVAVMDPLTVQAVVFNDRDFRIEWYSGTGAGGQHRNKHQNSCRLTHVPTATVVTAQCRARENSLEEARTALLARLNGVSSSQAHQANAATRKLQVGSGMRGDKVRTYREQDGTVTDHRSDKKAALRQVEQGRLQLLR